MLTLKSLFLGARTYNPVGQIRLKKETTKGDTIMPKILSHKEKVQRAVGKRPQSATQIAAKLGHNTHHGVAKDLGTLVKEGKVEKVKGKYAAR